MYLLGINNDIYIDTYISIHLVRLGWIEDKLGCFFLKMNQDKKS